MIKCKKCKKDNPNKAHFCQQCGISLEDKKLDLSTKHAISNEDSTTEKSWALSYQINLGIILICGAIIFFSASLLIFSSMFPLAVLFFILAIVCLRYGVKFIVLYHNRMMSM
ncbi:MAG: hypothetical protein ACMXYG_07555 [Candidatus Woesearchaeota archaeon]